MAYRTYSAIYWSIAAVLLFVSILFLVRFFIRRRNKSHTTYIVKQPTMIAQPVQPMPVVQYATTAPVVQYGSTAVIV